nr:DUF6543 domain-containing protein [Pseudomonas putida]
MHPPPFTDGSTDALIASRLPSWLTGASLNTLYSLHASQQWQQHVQHQLHEWLASILPLDAFAAPLLQQALYTRHGLTLDVRKAMLRRRTLQRFPSHIATLPDGVKEHVHQQSLLAAALHNFYRGGNICQCYFARHCRAGLEWPGRKSFAKGILHVVPNPRPGWAVPGLSEYPVDARRRAWEAAGGPFAGGLSGCSGGGTASLTVQRRNFQAWL